MFYIQTRAILAEPHSTNDYTPHDHVEYQAPGYIMTDKLGNQEWMRESEFKDVSVGINHPGESLKDVSITEYMVDRFIVKTEVWDIGEKTTCVTATLANGFEITETSSCVNKELYNQDIGKDICMTAIKDKVYMLLGFLLQSAINGFGGTQI